MSGGDLDGDQYLVIWDKELINNYSFKIRRTPPANYNHAANPNQQQQHKKTDWKTYVALWENTTLAEIDSCFYEVAEEFGVNSERCKELCEIFSRAVDNIPSDVKRLREISSRCSRPSKCSSSSCYSTNGKPIWDKLIMKGLELLENLRGESQNRFPDSEDWRVFHDSLVYSNEDDLERLLFTPLNQEVLGSAGEATKLMRNWSRILKKRSVNLQVADDAVECSFDCDDINCNNKHSTNPQFYKTRWMERLYEELSPFAQNIRDKRSKIKDELNIFDHLSNVNEKRERECNNDLSVRVNNHMVLKTYMDNAEALYIHIQDMLSKIGALQSQYNHLPFWDKGELILRLIQEIKGRLVKLFKQMALDINELAFMTHQKGILVVLFDDVLVGEQNFGDYRSVNIGERICMDCKRIVKEAHDRWIADYPKKALPETNVESIDQLVAMKLNEIEPLIGKLKKTENDLLGTERKIASTKDMATQTMKHIKEYETQDILLERIESSEAGTNYILETLLHDTNHIFDFLSMESRESFINHFLESGENLCYDNKDYDAFLEAVRKERRDKRHLINTNNDKRNRLLAEIEKLEGIKTMLEDEKEEIKREKMNFDREIKDLKRKRDNAYDEEKHTAKIEEYNSFHKEWIQGQLAGFDLAVSALENEIEIAFNFSEETQQLADSKFRLGITKALQLSFRRELIRCKRDKTNHNLPVFRKRGAVLESLRKHDAVIVVAHTGSGKSTQVPQYLADDLHHVLSIDDNKFAKIACTQPRRVACIRIAERVSQEYAGAVPIPVTKNEDNQREIVYGNTCIAAYPLYAKLSQLDQDRALDTEDRVGYDQPAPSKRLPREDRDSMDKTTSSSCSSDDLSDVDNRGDSSMVDASSSDGLDDLTGTPGVVGGWVGFHIGSKGKTGDEKKNSRKFGGDTRIHFVTEGLLLQKLKGSRESNYSCIIIDEAHERGCDTDLLLAHLHDIVKNSRKAYKGNNLKVVVMSASINAKQFSSYFDGCPIVNCEGKMHEVTCEYLPPPIQEKGDKDHQEGDRDSNHSREDSDEDSSWEDEDTKVKQQLPKDEPPLNNKPMKKSDIMKVLIRHVVDTIFNKILTPSINGGNYEKMGGGDILVFLPGQGEIHQCADAINERARELGVKKGGYVTRKVVCCTNIAETSLTIPDVTYVLDSGKAKKIQYNNTLRISALEFTDISQASAKQRKGRAGRVKPGHCFRLYSEEHHDKEMIPFDIPEMKQLPIDNLYLYAIDVFKGLEEIELMEDAQPDKESIESAKKRLLNLEYVLKSSESLQISTEGKFALSLNEEVSLEGAKMILVAKDSDAGMICDAIKLAVLLEENIYSDRSMNEERAKYTHEMGDHLTIFNLYAHFEEKLGRRSRREINETRKWCEKLDLNFGTLDQMTKQFDRVYQTIKKDNLCDIGSLLKDGLEKIKGVKQRNKNNKNQHRKGGKKKEKVLMDYDHVKNPTNLMKLVVAGYFHNICTYNDPEFIKAGYSLLTPTNYGDVDDMDPSKNATILKVRLNRDSTMKEHGDLFESTTAIFQTLFKPPSNENVYMITSSRIKPEWVKECASKKWADSIKLTIQDDTIQSFVKTHQMPHIGIPVMSKIKRDEIEIEEKTIKFIKEKDIEIDGETVTIKEEIIETKKKSVKLIHHLEKVSNARIHLFYDSCQIKVYGSEKEINRALYGDQQLKKVVKRFKNTVMNADIHAKYPKGKDKQEVCKIKSGLLVNGEPSIPRVAISNNMDEFQSAILILSDNKYGSLTEDNINTMLQGLKQYLPGSLQEVWETPEIMFCRETFAKVKFRRLDIAKRYEELLEKRPVKKMFFQNNPSCFMDSEIELRVYKTSLYPSIPRYVEEEFTSLKCVPNNNGNAFRISKKDNKTDKKKAGIEQVMLIERLGNEKV